MKTTTHKQLNSNETYLKCPAWIGKELNWLCDRKAEYAISGTILCWHHALEINNGNSWRIWFDNLQPAIKERNGVSVNYDYT